jgi:hypothetical protein
MFRRRRRKDDEVAPDGAQERKSQESGDGERPGEGAGDVPAIPTSPGSNRANGPWDVAEVDDPASSGARIDLGAMYLPGREGMELRIEVDEATGAPTMITVIYNEGVLQVQPFAAPRKEGIWDGVRAELRAGITQQGGMAEDREGPFGPEVDAKIPVQLPEGGSGLQAARFIGVDGPRWFLRGVISGAAYEDAEISGVLEGIFRDVVVVRGAEAMAPRDPLPLRMPEQAGGAPAGEDDSADPGEHADSRKPGYDDLKPFNRGPEITEVR